VLYDWVTSFMALKISFWPMRQKGQFCMRGRDQSHEGGGVWVTHEIIDDGEVNLLSGHCRGLRMREEKGEVC